MAYEAKIIADSVSEAGDRLTTMEVTFPRFVLAEFNTHRMFSRNSASSRAIPVEKQLARIMDDPFVPEYWGMNQSGMQADQPVDVETAQQARKDWLAGRDYAVEVAERLMALGIHKQLSNRLLEPFMWHTVIVTATEWSNFFALRAHKDAQPEIRTIAEMMKEIFETSEPKLLKQGEWHLPLIQSEEYDGKFEFSEEARKISAARCARVSYLTHDGKRDLAADLTLYERLVGGGHMSPLEHVATPWRKQFVHQEETKVSDNLLFKYKEQVRYPVEQDTGNFYGWKQFRKFIPNEQDYSLVAKNEE